LTLANTLAYYNTTTNIVFKGFIVQVSGLLLESHLTDRYLTDRHFVDRNFIDKLIIWSTKPRRFHFDRQSTGRFVVSTKCLSAKKLSAKRRRTLANLVQNFTTDIFTKKNISGQKNSEHDKANGATTSDRTRTLPSWT
jgi:hypothetical protein